MSRTIPYAFITLLAIPLLASCSVKEDRDRCPAYLTVRSDGHTGEPMDGRVLTYRLASEDEPLLERAEGAFAEFASSRGRIFKVPRRRRVDVTVLGSLRRMFFQGALLKIPAGDECDSLVCGSASIWIPGDLGELRVPLHRSYCNLRMDLVGQADDPCPYYFLVLSGTDGLTLPGLDPHEGPFRVQRDTLVRNGFSVRIPRQADDALSVEVRLREDRSLVTDMPVGAILAGMGYDWRKPDLDDIRLDIDFSQTTLTVSIADWSEAVTIRITI